MLPQVPTGSTGSFSLGIAIITLSIHHFFTTATLTELPFLDLGDETRVHDDGKFFGIDAGTKLLSETELPSNIHLPYCNGSEMRIYIASTLGVITFGSPPDENVPIDNQKGLAPYGTRIDLRHKGLVLYAALHEGQESRLNNSRAIFDIVNGYITDNVFKNCSSVFRARWILAVRWINVCSMQDPNCSKTESNNFQAVLATDGIRSYAIFTYKCGEQNWVDPIFPFAVIGFIVFNKSFAHPLSYQPNAKEIACINNNSNPPSNWSNVHNLLQSVSATFDPPQLVSDIESIPYKVNITFSLGIRAPPTLVGETLLCVFSNEERGITFNTTLSETMSCDFTSSLPKLTDIKLVTRFSLYSTLFNATLIAFEKNEYTFYNCSQGNNCRDCVTDGICGWCGNTCVPASTTCSTNFITTSCSCLSPMITSITPDSGPSEGGTTVTITGSDLGTSFSDIVSIAVSNLSCTPIEDSYLIGRRITCDIGSGNQTQFGNVDVTVSICKIPTKRKNTFGQFQFGQPKVYSVSPSYGPAAGGTIVRVRGEALNIGNKERTTMSLVGCTGRRRRQTMGTPFCDITSISANEIICRWSNVTTDMSGVVLVTVNNAMVQNNSVTYQYLNNPVYTELTPQQTIRAGGIKLTFTGQYLNVSQQPARLQFNNGLQSVMCQQSSSGTTLVCIAPPLSVLNNYTVIMDAAPGPDNMDSTLRLMLVDDPVVSQLMIGSRTVNLGANDSIITIEGQFLTNVEKEEITVMVGKDQCVVEAVADTFITCNAPQRDEPVIESVTVSFGQNINQSVGQLQYIAAPSIDTGAIAGGVTGGVVLILILVSLIVFTILYGYLSFISNLKNKIEHAQQPVYVFVPPNPSQDNGEIEVKSNIGYRKTTGIGSVPPAEEVEHIYEEFPYEEPIAAIHKCGDHDYVNDPEGEAYRQAIDEAEMRDDVDGCDVNGGLLPTEENHETSGNTAPADQEVTVKKTINSNGVNDPTQQEEEA